MPDGVWAVAENRTVSLTPTTSEEALRIDGRSPTDLRPVRLAPDFTDNPLASVLCEVGRTVILCTVSEEPSVPRFLRGTGRGWLTAE